MKPAVVLCIVFVALFVDALHAMPSQTVPTAKPVNGDEHHTHDKKLNSNCCWVMPGYSRRKRDILPEMNPASRIGEQVHVLDVPKDVPLDDASFLKPIESDGDKVVNKESLTRSLETNDRFTGF